MSCSKIFSSLFPIFTASLSFLLIEAPLVLAQAGAGAPGGAGGSNTPPSFGATFSRMLPMFAIIFFIFYFLVIRPQDKKLRAQQALLAELKRGESIVTTGGIIGRIASIDDDSVHIEVGGAGKLRIEKVHILRRYKKETTEKAPPSAANGE